MIITTATYTEAAPIVEALGLTLSQRRPAVYAGEGLRLLVTGIGPLAAAAALGSIVAKEQPVLNIGICAGSHIGRLYHIRKLIDDATGSSYILGDHPALPNATLRTLYRPAEKPYKELVDMEAAGLYGAAKLFGAKLQICKIVSDRYEPKSVDPAAARRLIQANLEPLLDIIAASKAKG